MLRSLSDWNPREVEEFDETFIFGLRGKGKDLLAAYPQAFVVDYGYLRRVNGEKEFETGHWQIGRGGLGQLSDNSTSARFDALGLTPQPWREKPGPRVLCGQHVGDAAHPFDTEEKLIEWVLSIPHDEFRPHPLDAKSPLEPLDNMLSRAGTVIVWNSTVGVDALMAGVPVEAHGPAMYKGVGRKERMGFLHRLANSQWTMSEMAMGLPQQEILGGD